MPHADVAQLVEAAVSETVSCEGSNPSIGTIVQGSFLRFTDALRHRGGIWHTQQLEVLRSGRSVRVRVPPVTPAIIPDTHERSFSSRSQPSERRPL